MPMKLEFKSGLKYDGIPNVNDTYHIKEDMFELKHLVASIEEDITAFLSHKKVKRRGVLARKKLQFIKKELLPDLQKKILKTKQDYEAYYNQ